MSEEKTDSKSPPEAASDDVTKAVAERLKFFFSDANVRADAFLRKELLHGSNPGHVDIETLLKFNSIKQHTTDPAVVAAAAKTLSDQLVLAEDAKSIARVTPFTMKMMDDNIPLSLYVTNVATTDDEKYAPTTMKEVRALFEPYGEVTLVKLRFKRNGEGKSVAAGGAFVEFATKEELAKAAEETLTKKDGEVVEAKKKLTVGDNTVEVMTLKDWLDAKRNKRKSDDGENKKRDREEKESKEKAVEEFKIDWKPGCVIRIKGLAENCDREAILGAVMKGLGISEKELKDTGIYADFSRGQTEGAIRFNEPADSIATLATKLASGEVQVADAKVESAEIIEGDEETKYWADFIEFKNKQIKHRAEERVSRKRSRRH